MSPSTPRPQSLILLVSLVGLVCLVAPPPAPRAGYFLRKSGGFWFLETKDHPDLLTLLLMLVTTGCSCYIRRRRAASRASRSRCRQRESLRPPVRPSLDDIRNQSTDDRRELEPVAAVAGGDDSPRPLGVVVDPEVAVERVRDRGTGGGGQSAHPRAAEGCRRGTRALASPPPAARAGRRPLRRADPSRDGQSSSRRWRAQGSHTSRCGRCRRPQPGTSAHASGRLVPRQHE